MYFSKTFIQRRAYRSYLPRQTLLHHNYQLPFIPKPPLSHDMHLCADGRFGEHDPTRVPQFYDETICHHAVISWRPKADNIDHPYRDFMVIWQDVETQRDVMWSQGSMSGIGILRRDFLEDLQRAYNHIDIRCSDAFKHSGIPDSYRLLLKVCHSRMGALLQRIGKVSSDLMTIKVMVTTAQRFWLEMAAAMDYMDYFRPVMDGLAQKNPCRKSDRLMGAFTTNVDVVQSFCAAGIPVYFVRPLTLFDNQIILKVVPLLRSSSIICELPQCPYPVVFTGAPSDPQKTHRSP